MFFQCVNDNDISLNINKSVQQFLFKWISKFLYGSFEILFFLKWIWSCCLKLSSQYVARVESICEEKAPQIFLFREYPRSSEPERASISALDEEQGIARCLKLHSSTRWYFFGCVSLPSNKVIVSISDGHHVCKKETLKGSQEKEVNINLESYSR